jgi:hypothetical protein
MFETGGPQILTDVTSALSVDWQVFGDTVVIIASQIVARCPAKNPFT